MLMNCLMAQYSKASLVSPVGQPFSSTGAPPDEVLRVGDQLHISNSAFPSGWREGLSLGSGEEGGLRIVGRWSTAAERVAPHPMPSSCVSPWSCVHPCQSPVPWTVLRHCRLPRHQGGAVCRQAYLELCQSSPVKELS